MYHGNRWIIDSAIEHCAPEESKEILCPCPTVKALGNRTSSHNKMSETILRGTKYSPTVKAGISSEGLGKPSRRALNASRPTPPIAPIKSLKRERPSNAFLRPSRAPIANDGIPSAYSHYVPRVYGDNLAAYSSKASTGFRVWGNR